MLGWSVVELSTLLGLLFHCMVQRCQIGKETRPRFCRILFRQRGVRRRGSLLCAAVRRTNTLPLASQALEPLDVFDPAGDAVTPYTLEEVVEAAAAALDSLKAYSMATSPMVARAPGS